MICPSSLTYRPPVAGHPPHQRHAMAATRQPDTRAGLILLQLLFGLVVLLLAQPSQALPLFARQTGQACVACHVSFPELTPYGRWFKLNGYTIGKRADIPLAIMANVGVERMATPTDAAGNLQDSRDGAVSLSAASLFAGGRISDNAGAFLQWTYTPYNFNYPNPQQYGGYAHADNMDLRLVGRSEPSAEGFPDWVYGLTVHNNPTVQDVWNGTPAFGYPWQGPQFANARPAAATLIDGGLGQQAVGIGAYVYWDRTLYGELTAYRNPQGPLNLMTWRVDAPAAPLHGTNPYLRLAYNREWGANSLEVGTYLARFALQPGQDGDPVDRYTDSALDVQYQYITEAHAFSVIGTAIHEHQQLDYTYGVAGGSDNASNTLDTRRVKATYFYHHTYGGSFGLFQTTGSNDATLYMVNGGLNYAVPDTRGYVAELDYQPVQNVRILAQYTGYTRFNGGSTNVDGMGRSAHDNNVFYLDVWFAY